MKKQTLFLHVGWSKTGTSAIQKQIHHLDKEFAEKGILYPKTLQWNDHSHHPFALSFQGSGSYQSDMTPQQALQKLNEEMQSSPAHSVLLSSELSPFYFSNPAFKAFVEHHFEKVEVLFTVRRQSELLLSLFNQLIKDPNVRYPASLFTLAFQNAGKLNFNHHIGMWANIVGKENITVIPYGEDVVTRFIAKFGIILSEESRDAAKNTVNESIPTRALAIVQARCRHVADNPQYVRIRNHTIEQCSQLPIERDTFVLFSRHEQNAIDQHYLHANKLVASTYLNTQELFPATTYQDIKAIPPGIDLDKALAESLKQV